MLVTEQAVSGTGVEATTEQSVYDTITATSEHVFSLNHPKNYFGVVVAAADDRPMELLLPELSSMAREGCVGAEALGLLNRDRSLTPAGELFVEKATKNRDVESVFADIVDSSRTRFCEVDGLSQVSQATITRYPVVGELVGVLDSTGQLTLADLADVAMQSSDILAEYLLDGGSESAAVDDVSSYNSNVTYQFKSILYHTGVVTNPGSDTTHLDPVDNIWALSPRLDDDLKRRTAMSERAQEFVDGSGIQKILDLVENMMLG
jgi:hypothetical protein